MRFSVTKHAFHCRACAGYHVVPHVWLSYGASGAPSRQSPGPKLILIRMAFYSSEVFPLVHPFCNGASGAPSRQSPARSSILIRTACYSSEVSPILQFSPEVRPPTPPSPPRTLGVIAGSRRAQAAVVRSKSDSDSALGGALRAVLGAAGAGGPIAPLRPILVRMPASLDANTWLVHRCGRSAC